MKVVSVNVGLPREVEWRGEIVTTGIFKEPVAHRVKVNKQNLDGDRQADLRVHGGDDKAIYVYPSEHYEFWKKELPEMSWQWGMFGENLTVSGLFEDSAFIGDKLRVGSAEVVVTQPRMPCHKLALRFRRPDMIKRFLDSRRSGFYLRVLREGEVAAGDEIEWSSRSPKQISVTEIVRLYAIDRHDTEGMLRAIDVEALPEGWKQYFKDQLQNPGNRAL
jgi:MOSC domain-containing protein YiiM